MYLEGTESNKAFIDNWYKAKEKRNELAEFNSARTGNSKSKTDYEWLNFRRERAESRKLACKNLIEKGFRYFGGKINNKYVNPFIDKNPIRSKYMGVNLKRVVQITNKANKGLLCGNSKDSVMPTDSKMLGLTEAYITMNKIVRSVFRIDIDKEFENLKKFKKEYEKCNMPTNPHIIIFEKRNDQKIVNPHIWFFLPYKEPVWYDENNEKCSKYGMGKYDKVHRSICNALIPIGADHGCLNNPMHGKNPLSPHWKTISLSEKDGINIKEWMNWAIKNNHIEVNKKEKIVDEILNKSNGIFIATKNKAISEIIRLKENNKALFNKFVKDRSLFVEHLYNVILDFITDKVEEEKAEKLARQQAEYFGNGFKANKFRYREIKNKGIFKDIIKGKTKEEKIKITAIANGLIKAEEVKQKLIQSAYIIEISGKSINTKNLKELSGCSYPTIRKYFVWILEELKKGKSKKLKAEVKRRLLKKGRFGEPAAYKGLASKLKVYENNPDNKKNPNPKSIGKTSKKTRTSRKQTRYPKLKDEIYNYKLLEKHSDNTIKIDISELEEYANNQQKSIDLHKKE